MYAIKAGPLSALRIVFLVPDKDSINIAEFDLGSRGIWHWLCHHATKRRQDRQNWRLHLNQELAKPFTQPLSPFLLVHLHTIKTAASACQPTPRLGLHPAHSSEPRSPAAWRSPRWWPQTPSSLMVFSFLSKYYTCTKKKKKKWDFTKRGNHS